MTSCSHCGTENPDSARLCRECGRALPVDAVRSEASGGTEASSAGIRCPSCGQAAGAYDQFCSACGRNLQDAEYAGFWRRLGGYLLDYVIVNVATFIPAVVVAAVIMSGAPDDAFTQQQRQQQEDAEAYAAIAATVIGLVISVGYLVSLNANGGTWGKRIVGLRLEDGETGANIGYLRAFVRYIVAIASHVAILLGYLWCIWDDRKQTWHDKAAGSVVVRD